MRFWENSVDPRGPGSTPRTAAAGEPEQAPVLGEITETIRQTLTKEYGVVPPNLNTSIGDDGTMTLSAVDASKGLNIQIIVADLNAAPPPQSPQMAPQQPPAGEPIVPSPQGQGMQPPPQTPAPMQPPAGTPVV